MWVLAKRSPVPAISLAPIIPSRLGHVPAVWKLLV